jgi:hypothetical protein
METAMTKTWWWVIGGLTAVQAPYWAMIVVRVINA